MVAAARASVRISPDFAEANAALGSALLWYEWDVPGAVQHLSAALRLQPQDSFVRHEYAWALLAAGEVDLGLEQIQSLASIEPLSPNAIMDIGWAMLRSGRLPEAILASRRALLLQPDHSGAHYCVMSASYLLGDYETFLAHVVEYGERWWGLEAAQLAGAESNVGLRDRSDSVLKWMIGTRSEDHELPLSYDAAATFALLGDADEAFRNLAGALRDRSMSMLTLRLDPSFESLHADPRYAQLLAQLPR
jgi:tetratricopeptide (TPR) repeat protein